MLISIIIPTYNEITHISKLILHLKQNSRVHEIIISDGGSVDGTIHTAEALGIKVLKCPVKGRSQQLNFGALHASGDIFYFVHADTMPPNSFEKDIHTAIKEGYKIGCFRFKFDSDRILLKLNAYFTRFDRLMCRGGDQSLFITKDLFNRLKGYSPDHKIMEDYDIIIRARKSEKFKIIPKDMIVSARKYEYNSYLKVNITNLAAFAMYFAKFDHDRILKFYRNMLNHEAKKLKY